MSHATIYDAPAAEMYALIGRIAQTCNKVSGALFDLLDTESDEARRTAVRDADHVATSLYFSLNLTPTGETVIASRPRLDALRASVAALGLHDLVALLDDACADAARF